jgi:hypothetical protein
MSKSLHSRLRVGGVDKFFVVRLGEDKALLPEGYLGENVAKIIWSLRRQYSVVFDCRNIHGLVTEDVRDFLSLFKGTQPTLMAYEEQLEHLRGFATPHTRILPLRRGEFPIDYNDVCLDDYDQPEYNDYTFDRDWWWTGDPPPNKREWMLLCRSSRSLRRHKDFESYKASFEYPCASFYLKGAHHVYNRRNLEELVRDSKASSALSQLAIHLDNSGIKVIPLQSHSVHTVEFDKDVIIARPSIIAKRTQTLLRGQIAEFECLLNRPTTRELEIQQFLELHPQIFHAMGYGRVYSQVTLARDNGTSLRPDFVVEPIGSDWAEIIDIKRPYANLVVGGRDRRTLATGVHQLIAQLREYAAYFEDPKLATRVETKYGIKCYRPKLIGIIGRNPHEEDERQLRRLMTQYTDVSVLTFDRLLHLARSRLLL